MIAAGTGRGTAGPAGTGVEPAAMAVAVWRTPTAGRGATGTGGGATGTGGRLAVAANGGAPGVVEEATETPPGAPIADDAEEEGPATTAEAVAVDRRLVVGPAPPSEPDAAGFLGMSTEETRKSRGKVGEVKKKKVKDKGRN